MSWLYFALSGYFINAITAVIDKFLLGEQLEVNTEDQGRISDSLTYSFYVGLLSIFAIVLAPFGLHWPGLSQFFISLIIGAIFLAALMVYFVAIKRSEASRVVPIIGAFTPIFIFILSYFFLEEGLNRWELVSFIFLVLGAALISIRKDISTWLQCSIIDFGILLLAALLFALFYTGVKFIFTQQDFISGFIWTRIGSFLLALFLLIPVRNRKIIFRGVKRLKIKTGGIVVLNKALGGLAFLLNNYAIALGNVILVNALQGVQYVFLFLFTLFLSYQAPWILEEKVTALSISQKAIAILLISFGLFLLSFS